MSRLSKNTGGSDAWEPDGARTIRPLGAYPQNTRSRPVQTPSSRETPGKTTRNKKNKPEENRNPGDKVREQTKLLEETNRQITFFEGLKTIRRKRQLSFRFQEEESQYIRQALGEAAVLRYTLPLYPDYQLDLDLNVKRTLAKQLARDIARRRAPGYNDAAEISRYNQDVVGTFDRLSQLVTEREKLSAELTSQQDYRLRLTDKDAKRESLTREKSISWKLSDIERRLWQEEANLAGLMMHPETADRASLYRTAYRPSTAQPQPGQWEEFKNLAFVSGQSGKAGLASAGAGLIRAVGYLMKKTEGKVEDAAHDLARWVGVPEQELPEKLYQLAYNAGNNLDREANWARWRAAVEGNAGAEAFLIELYVHFLTLLIPAMGAAKLGSWMSELAGLGKTLGRAGGLGALGAATESHKGRKAMVRQGLLWASVPVIGRAAGALPEAAQIPAVFLGTSLGPLFLQPNFDEKLARSMVLYQSGQKRAAIATVASPEVARQMALMGMVGVVAHISRPTATDATAGRAPTGRGRSTTTQAELNRALAREQAGQNSTDAEGFSEFLGESQTGNYGTPNSQLPPGIARPPGSPSSLAPRPTTPYVINRGAGPTSLSQVTGHGVGVRASSTGGTSIQAQSVTAASSAQAATSSATEIVELPDVTQPTIRPVVMPAHTSPGIPPVQAGQRDRDRQQSPIGTTVPPVGLDPNAPPVEIVFPDAPRLNGKPTGARPRRTDDAPEGYAAIYAPDGTLITETRSTGQRTKTTAPATGAHHVSAVDSASTLPGEGNAGGEVVTDEEWEKLMRRWQNLPTLMVTPPLKLLGHSTEVPVESIEAKTLPADAPLPAGHDYAILRKPSGPVLIYRDQITLIALGLADLSLLLDHAVQDNSDYEFFASYIRDTKLIADQLELIDPATFMKRPPRFGALSVEALIANIAFAVALAERTDHTVNEVFLELLNFYNDVLVTHVVGFAETWQKLVGGNKLLLDHFADRSNVLQRPNGPALQSQQISSRRPTWLALELNLGERGEIVGPNGVQEFWVYNEQKLPQNAALPRGAEGVAVWEGKHLKIVVSGDTSRTGPNGPTIDWLASLAMWQRTLRKPLAAEKLSSEDVIEMEALVQALAVQETIVAFTLGNQTTQRRPFEPSQLANRPSILSLQTVAGAEATALPQSTLTIANRWATQLAGKTKTIGREKRERRFTPEQFEHFLVVLLTRAELCTVRPDDSPILSADERNQLASYLPKLKGITISPDIRSQAQPLSARPPRFMGTAAKRKENVPLVSLAGTSTPVTTKSKAETAAKPAPQTESETARESYPIYADIPQPEIPADLLAQTAAAYDQTLAAAQSKHPELTDLPGLARALAEFELAPTHGLPHEVSIQLLRQHQTTLQAIIPNFNALHDGLRVIIGSRLERLTGRVITAMDIDADRRDDLDDYSDLVHSWAALETANFSKFMVSGPIERLQTALIPEKKLAEEQKIPGQLIMFAFFDGEQVRVVLRDYPDLEAATIAPWAGSMAAWQRYYASVADRDWLSIESFEQLGKAARYQADVGGLMRYYNHRETASAAMQKQVDQGKFKREQWDAIWEKTITPAWTMWHKIADAHGYAGTVRDLAQDWRLKLINNTKIRLSWRHPDHANIADLPHLICEISVLFAKAEMATLHPDLPPLLDAERDQVRHYVKTLRQHGLVVPNSVADAFQKPRLEKAPRIDAQAQGVKKETQAADKFWDKPGLPQVGDYWRHVASRSDTSLEQTRQLVRDVGPEDVSSIIQQTPLGQPLNARATDLCRVVIQIANNRVPAAILRISDIEQDALLRAHYCYLLIQLKVIIARPAPTAQPAVILAKNGFSATELVERLSQSKGGLDELLLPKKSETDDDDNSKTSGKTREERKAGYVSPEKVTLDRFTEALQRTLENEFDGDVNAMKRLMDLVKEHGAIAGRAKFDKEQLDKENSRPPETRPDLVSDEEFLSRVTDPQTREVWQGTHGISGQLLIKARRKLSTIIRATTLAETATDIKAVLRKRNLGEWETRVSHGYRIIYSWRDGRAVDIIFRNHDFLDKDRGMH